MAADRAAVQQWVSGRHAPACQWTVRLIADPPDHSPGVMIAVHQALQVEPANTRFRIALGQALFSQGMASMAEEQFRKAIEGDPNNAEAHFNYAIALSHGPRADIQTARTCWEAVVRLDGDGELGRQAKTFLAHTAQSRTSRVERHESNVTSRTSRDP